MNFAPCPPFWPPALRWGGAIALLFLGAGCGREDIRAYRVPKEKASDTSAAHEPAMREPAALPEVKWKTPEGWEQTEATGMRVARFRIKSPADRDTDVSIIPLAGLQGRDFEIVNLWRNELGLGPEDQAAVESTSTKVEIAGQSGRMFELVSGKPILDQKFIGRIVAVLLSHEGSTWCFKMAGEDAHVVSLKKPFMDLLQSVSFRAPSVAAAPPARGPVEGASAKPAWDIPPGWVEQPPTQMVLAKFVASGEAGVKVEITVSAFPGDVGGLAANVNRWRDQLSLPPVSGDQLNAVITRLEVGGLVVSMVDMSGTEKRSGQPARMLGAVVPRDGQTWFYKLVGHPQMAGREKEAFTKFVQSARYPNG